MLLLKFSEFKAFILGQRMFKREKISEYVMKYTLKCARVKFLKAKYKNAVKADQGSHGELKQAYVDALKDKMSERKNIRQRIQFLLN